MINIKDQRKNPGTEINIDPALVEEYAKIAGIDHTDCVIKIRFRNGAGPYGFTGPCTGGFRVVINIRNSKATLSEGAAYVVSNTLLHELRHAGQGQESGWHSLSGDYQGWSETEAREYGRKIKGNPAMYAVR